MDYKEIAIYLLGVLQILVAYVYRSYVLENKERFQKIELKIEKIENGDFIRNEVQNVIYLPASRDYFKSIFTEVLNHQKKNDNAISLAILQEIKNLQKIKNKKNDLQTPTD